MSALMAGDEKIQRDIIQNIGKWLWYLIPANPILVRVVHGGSRRDRHLWIRFGYLSILFGVFLFSYMALSSSMAGSLAEVAKSSTQIFMVVSYTQLGLICICAPVFTAGAITQERDEETYNILLTTPLTNAQIIFGTLLSRLYFVIVLLLSGLPIFCITMLYGGVTLSQILLSFAIAGGTAIFTGALAIMSSMVWTRTRRTIISFYLAIGVYLLVVYVLAQLPFTHVQEAGWNIGDTKRMSWLAAFHPFLSLEVGLNRVPAPSFSEVAHHGWPSKYLLAYPHMSYVAITLLVSLAMTTFSVFFARRVTREGEPTLWGRILQKVSFGRRGNTDRRRKPQRVWSNPVAWREASSRASAASSIFARYLMIFIGVSLAIAILLSLINQTVVSWGGKPTPFGAEQARFFLEWLVTVEFVLILVVATNASATSLTKERESNSMDILLTTPLTSKYIIWGKLRGLISFTLPLLSIPLLTLLLFVVYGLWNRGKPSASIVNVESVFELVTLLTVFIALACVIGLHTSLKSKKTVRSVAISFTTIAMIFGLLYLVGEAIVSNADEAGALFAPFTPFTAIRMITNPGAYGLKSDSASLRIMLLIGSAVAAVVFGLIVSWIYTSIVRNFDMIVRKQTAS